MATLEIKSAAETKWDCVSFGEVMLRFDPGFGRVRNARSFQVWEGCRRTTLAGWWRTSSSRAASTCRT